MMKLALDTLTARAIQEHRNGNLAEAERLYGQILANAPENFFGLHSLGVLRAQQGRDEEAIDLIGRATKVNPDEVEAWLNLGSLLEGAGRNSDALISYSTASTLAPNYLSARKSCAKLLLKMQRFNEALAAYDAILSVWPDDLGALYDHGNLLWNFDRSQEALVSFDRALLISPDELDILNARGNLLRHMRDFEGALACYDRVLATSPNLAAVLNNRGVALSELQRHAEALDNYTQALAIEPGLATAWNNRGFSLRELKHFDDAVVSYAKAVALDPTDAAAFNNLGKLLCELNQISSGFAAFKRAAELTAEQGSPAPASLSQQRRLEAHCQAQTAYLSGKGVSDPDLSRKENGGRLAGGTVNRANIRSALRAWRGSTPNCVVIDDFLTSEALKGIRDFCLGSTIWTRAYEEGYVAAFPESGLACPLLAQVVEDLRDAHKAIIGSHALRYLWAFKYDSQGSGTRVHADEAAVNVNFWITPNEANADPLSGGLIIWDQLAPSDWDFSRYNNDALAAQALLRASGAVQTVIPYRTNRAVIFDSNLFHATDAFRFKPGYADQRINITMLFGRRGDTDARV